MKGWVQRRATKKERCEAGGVALQGLLTCRLHISELQSSVILLLLCHQSTSSLTRPPLFCMFKLAQARPAILFIYLFFHGVGCFCTAAGMYQHVKCDACHANVSRLSTAGKWESLTERNSLSPPPLSHILALQQERLIKLQSASHRSPRIQQAAAAKATAAWASC